MSYCDHEDATIMMVYKKNYFELMCDECIKGLDKKTSWKKVHQ
jgi:hypothetical protein